MSFLRLSSLFRVEGPVTAPLLDEPVIQEIAAKYNKTPAHILLRNLMQRDIIVLPKSVNDNRIVSNFQVCPHVSDTDMRKLCELFPLVCSNRCGTSR